MNGLYLVCDGGGTKTDFLLFEKTGRVRGRAQGAGANANFVPPAEAAHTVYAGVMECLAQAGAAPAQVREFVLFIPGFRPALPELETLLGSGNVRQLGDEKNAFYAALGAPCGIAVLSGTGSFATGRDKAGRTATAGGWGPLFSDEGSGYHIGVLCLSRLALLHDTHVTGTLLEKNVLEMLGLPDVLSIRDAAYRPDFTRRHVARLSYAVERSAREGDANACAVLDEAACALARLAATVAGQLDADGLPVALTGGVARMGELFTGRFRRALEHLVPQCVFGAETILMNRCKNEELFEQTVHLINDFKEYFLSHGEPVGENPSPGNKAGGISTLEEKALGCTQKCGKSYVSGVMPYGERLQKKGLNLLSAPGNDLVAATTLAASGCHMVLFTTGRGTPFGTFVPTMKISTNSTLAKNKPGWIDFNAGVIVENEPMEKTCERFIDYIIKVASGEFVNNEKKGYREIAIFKTGVTL